MMNETRRGGFPGVESEIWMVLSDARAALWTGSACEPDVGTKKRAASPVSGSHSALWSVGVGRCSNSPAIYFFSSSSSFFFFFFPPFLGL